MAAKPIADHEWQRTLAALEAANWNVTAAARAMGAKRETIRNRIISARARKIVPDGPPLDGYLVKGESTLYDGEGNVTAKWVKTDVDKERQEEMAREMIAALMEGIIPATKTKSPTTETSKNLFTAYMIGDAHLGLYAWAAESGDDFDTMIAKKDLMGAADRQLASTPASDECMVVNLGDFFHMDNTSNETPRGHNRLDVDTRFRKVVNVGIKVMRYIIDGALKKHKLVRVRDVEGNHDPHSSIILTEALRGYYANEPRVLIEDSPKTFWTFRFGSCLVGITHGHGGKPEEYAGRLAVEAQSDWGTCPYRYVWHGHFHTKRVIERLGVITECFRTLAARDFWHAENGYLAGREMQAITLHKDFGEIERHTASLKQIREGS